MGKRQSIRKIWPQVLALASCLLLSACTWVTSIGGLTTIVAGSTWRGTVTGFTSDYYTFYSDNTGYSESAADGTARAGFTWLLEGGVTDWANLILIFEDKSTASFLCMYDGENLSLGKTDASGLEWLDYRLVNSGVTK